VVAGARKQLFENMAVNEGSCSLRWEKKKDVKMKVYP
jgi:hypothetical protein